MSLRDNGDLERIADGMIESREIRIQYIDVHFDGSGSIGFYMGMGIKFGFRISIG